MFPFKHLRNMTTKGKSPSSSQSAAGTAAATTATNRFHSVPSVSQIAPLPAINSLSQLPILSIDGRTMPDEIPEENRLSVTSNTHSSVSIERSLIINR